MSSTRSSSWWQPTPCENDRDLKRVACLPVLMGALSVSSTFSGNGLRDGRHRDLLRWGKAERSCHLKEWLRDLLQKEDKCTGSEPQKGKSLGIEGGIAWPPTPFLSFFL